MTDFTFEDYGPDTIALHAGHTPDQDTLSRAVPIYQTSSYVFRDAEHAAEPVRPERVRQSSTPGSPTPPPRCWRSAWPRMHGAAGALATASGAAAIFYAVATITSAGQNFVTGDKLYGGTYTQFSTR